jgi:hypothetical protein
MTRVRILFGGVVFLASFLLFLVEPIAAKQLLPVLGGSAAVWITCLVFFQTALLCAYLYAHWQARRSRWSLHFGLLAIASASAIAWAARSVATFTSAIHPFFTIFAALTLSIGLPFLALGATSPLMQVWWSRLLNASIPYRLFALSNLASLLALALYPTLIEPNLSLKMQRIVWCCGFAVFAAISAMLAWKTRSAAEVAPLAAAADTEDTDRGSSRFSRLLWLLLPMGAAMQLSAVTSFITANVVAIPLLWILPLAVYLLTLIIAFQFPRLVPRNVITRFLIVMLAGLGYMLSQMWVTHPMTVTIGFLLSELLFACLFFHSEAYALRPIRTSESTAFYLFFAAGGALGSSLIGIAAPLLYRYNYDLAITFLLTALLALAVTWREGWSRRLLWAVASILMAMLISWIHAVTVHNTMVAVRNFYGSLRVIEDYSHPGTTVRTLFNGNIQHGAQIFGTDQMRRTPTTYYTEDSGAGLALRLCCADRPRNIGVIGLGAGTVAAYARPVDRTRFYEVNPAVEPIAKNVFTFMRESGAKITIAQGDARTSLASEAPQGFDVLVVDAFSGDAIPLHLLTKEAFDLYKKHLAPGGVIALHVSNMHVNLEPPVALLAKAEDLRAIRISSFTRSDRHEYKATWILLGDNPAFFEQPEVLKAGKVAEVQPGLKLWTDDYSSLWPVLRW